MHVSREFDKMYTDTFIRVYRDGYWMPAHVRSVNGTEEQLLSLELSVIYRSRNGQLASTNVIHAVENDHIHTIDTTPPELGCLNLQKHTIATYVAWSQSRQWKRGFRRNRTNFRTAMSDAVMPFAGVARGLLSYKWDVWEVFNPTYYSVMEAKKKLDNSEALSVAFHPKYWLALSPVDHRIILGYKLWPVGTVVDEDRVLLSFAFSHLAQELQPIIEHQDMEVVVDG